MPHIFSSNMPFTNPNRYHFYHNIGGQAKELDMQDGMHIDIGQEVGRLKRTLHDARRRIMFRAEVATVKNCRKLVRACFFFFLHACVRRWLVGEALILSLPRHDTLHHS